MATRSTDWSPLAESDPVPGRADDVRAEGVKLKQVADSIRDQVTALRRVADADQNGALRGQYVGKLASTARSLADHLTKAEGRYRTASGELALWVTALDIAQTDSENQRQRAQAAQRDIDANTPTPPHGAPSSAAQPAPPPTAAQQASVADAQNRIAAERAALARTVATLHDQARIRAKNIRDACQQDGLKDSRWDRFKHTIDHWSRRISDACNVLGWIATGLAIVALFVPGLNVVVLAAMTWGAIAATGLSLAGHSMLAASGDGSWFDVGLDVFALATFGVGRVAGQGAEVGERSLQSGLKGGGAAIRAGDKAFADAVAADPKLAAAYKAWDDPALGVGSKAFHLGEISERYPMAAGARDAAKRAAADLADRGEAKVPKVEIPGAKTFWNGDRGIAPAGVWARNVAAAMSDDPDVVAQADRLGAKLGTVGTAWRLGTGADIVDKVFGSTLPYFQQSPGPGYNKVTRSPFTMPIGGTF